jgi:hypothetical protein
VKTMVEGFEPSARCAALCFRSFSGSRSDSNSNGTLKPDEAASASDDYDSRKWRKGLARKSLARLPLVRIMQLRAVVPAYAGSSERQGHKCHEVGPSHSDLQLSGGFHRSAQLHAQPALLHGD